LAKRPSRPGVQTPGVTIPIDRLEPEAVYAIGGEPDWIAPAEAERSAWVARMFSDSVSRLETDSDVISATVELGAGARPCSGLAVGFGSLWVPNCGDKTIARIDLKTNAVVARISSSIGFREGSIATGAGSVWLMTDRLGTLTRFDPASNSVIAKTKVGTGSYGLAYGADALWVTSSTHGTVARVDPETNLVTATIPVAKSPRFIAVGEGAVWVVSQAAGSVTRIDPSTNQVVATIELGVPGPGGDITAGEGSVWVSHFDFPLTRIDPAANQVAQQFFGPGGDAVRIGLGSLWISNVFEGPVWRLDPREVEAAHA
jgi:YVTN family beta-propeller protein